MWVYLIWRQLFPGVQHDVFDDTSRAVCQVSLGCQIECDHDLHACMQYNLCKLQTTLLIDVPIAISIRCCSFLVPLFFFVSLVFIDTTNTFCSMFSDNLPSPMVSLASHMYSKLPVCAQCFRTALCSTHFVLRSCELPAERHSMAALRSQVLCIWGLSKRGAEPLRYQIWCSHQFEPVKVDVSRCDLSSVPV
jgi:hypothetical protein